MQFSPATPLHSNYLPQHPVNEAFSTYVLPLEWETKFHTHKTSDKTTVSFNLIFYVLNNPGTSLLTPVEHGSNFATDFKIALLLLGCIILR